MLFKRREKQSFLARLRQWLWPRSGWRRSVGYIGHRLGRMTASPHAIAAGFASGIAISFTPFLGLHVAGAALISLVTRGHLVSSVIGTFIGNPWTFPLIFAMTGNLGAWYLGVDITDMLPSWDWGALWDDPLGYLGTLVPGLKPFIYGGVPAAIIAWIVSYALVKRGLMRYRAKRAHRRTVSKVLAKASGANYSTPSD